MNILEEEDGEYIAEILATFQQFNRDKTRPLFAVTADPAEVKEFFGMFDIHVSMRRSGPLSLGDFVDEMILLGDSVDLAKLVL